MSKEMSKPQFITTEAGEELVVLSRRDYDAMLARAGDDAAEDAMTLRLIEERGGELSLPETVWEAIEAAPSPVGPLRKWRGLTQIQVAERAGIAQAYLSEIETGKKPGELGSLRRIATALGVGLEDVMPLDD